MIPVTQTKTGGPDLPPEERGDCVAACVASILEIPSISIPHSDEPGWTQWAEIHSALAPYGYSVVYIDGAVPPVAYWIASVPSLNLKDSSGKPLGHAIVMEHETVAHDPSLGKRYEVGTRYEDLIVNSGKVLVPHPQPFPTPSLIFRPAKT